MGAFEFAAFELTPEEKHSIKGDVDDLLLDCAAILDPGRRDRSIYDYSEGLRKLREAKLLASDSDVCEYGPLGKIEIYLGHILRVLNKLPEARDAYARAARIVGRNSWEKGAWHEAKLQLVKSKQQVSRNKRQGGVLDDYDIEAARLAGLKTDNAKRDMHLKILGNHPEHWDPEPMRIKVVEVAHRSILVHQ